MHNSYAENAIQRDTSWTQIPAMSMSFSGAAAEYVSAPKTTAKQSAQDTIIQETEKLDALTLNPYTQTLKQQILQIIKGESLTVIYDTLADLSYEFEARGLEFIASALNEELSLLAAEYGNVTPKAEQRLRFQRPPAPMMPAPPVTAQHMSLAA